MRVRLKICSDSKKSAAEEIQEEEGPDEDQAIRKKAKTMKKRIRARVRARERSRARTKVVIKRKTRSESFS